MAHAVYVTWDIYKKDRDTRSRYARCLYGPVGTGKQPSAREYRPRCGTPSMAAIAKTAGSKKGLGYRPLQRPPEAHADWLLFAAAVDLERIWLFGPPPQPFYAKPPGQAPGGMEV